MIAPAVRPASMASASDFARTTSSGMPSAARTVAGSPEVMTMLSRPRRGRKRAGMECHVWRPMMTALRVPSGAVCVTYLKNAMSVGIVQGSVPSRPIPPVSVVQTTSVTSGTSLTADGKFSRRGNPAGSVMDAAIRASARARPTAPNGV